MPPDADPTSKRPEEIGLKAHLRHSHMTLVCNYAVMRSKEFHLRV